METVFVLDQQKRDIGLAFTVSAALFVVSLLSFLVWFCSLQCTDRQGIAFYGLFIVLVHMLWPHFNCLSDPVLMREHNMF